MGCSGSTNAQLLPADVIDGAKRFFGLDDLPLTVTATARGPRLEVHAVGIDGPNIFSDIMYAFAQRHFSVAYASVHGVRGLFKSRFNLIEGKQIQSIVDGDITARLSDSMSRELSTGLNHASIVHISESLPDETVDSISGLSPVKLYIQEEAKHNRNKMCLDGSKNKDVKSTAREQLKEFERIAKKVGATMRMSIKRVFTPFLRIALLKSMKAAGLKIVVAQLTTTRRGNINDILWLKPDKEGDNEVLKESFQADSMTAEWISQLVKKVQWATSDMTPAKYYQEGSKAPCEVANDIKLLARRISTSSADSLIPKVLQDKQRNLAYRLDLESDGEQLEGLFKYCGAGWSRSAGGTDVIEFATYFVNSSTLHPEKTNTLANFFRKSEKCGEFITQYDPIEQTFTVFKVFLNSVLPAGKNIGPRLVAEQLLLKGHKERLKATFDGAAAISKVEIITLCDVVNWNTYSLMNAVGRKIESDLEKWIIGEEAKASGLTLAELEASTSMQVFAKTVLGKLVQRTLKVWREIGLADKEIEEVEVKFEETFEMIEGEFRPTMDIVARLRDVQIPLTTTL
eukprot:TRINITY_DN3387_c0_g1_i3.p1 TRINITY_DN3387_c0_g1~~TRINITY_DN3387_c0_g1_i3.p1  ORF type:complete len:570 (-),score=71.28 TRINITY_DN3387_c0_g1_i3:114-1823(-)